MELSQENRQRRTKTTTPSYTYHIHIHIKNITLTQNQNIEHTKTHLKEGKMIEKEENEENRSRKGPEVVQMVI